MCTAHGADALIPIANEAAAANAPRCRVLRGGCYGLCELAPNVVVRRSEPTDTPDVDADRLTLTGGTNETVYCTVHAPEMTALLRAHLVDDKVEPTTTRETRERESPPQSEIARRIRELRERRLQ